jgi:hypothetical protein
MKTDHKFGGRTTSRFDGSQKHYHKPFREDNENQWDEWTGDKTRGPFRVFLGSLFHMMGTLLVGAIILAAVFFGVSFIWKLIFPMIGK